ncbi:MAG: rhodanese-like domain-containing protein [Gammaproteobacteria bacterium]
MDPATAQARVRDGALMVDVREPNEIDTLGFDVPDLVTLRMAELETGHTALPRDRALIFVCQVGVRSRQAAEFLAAHGAQSVANLAGGIVAWAKAGLPVHGDPASATAGGGCCSAPAEPGAGSCCGGDAKPASSCCG